MKKVFLYISLLLGVATLGTLGSSSAQSMGAQDLGRDPQALAQMMQSMQNNPYGAEVELDENGNPIVPEEQADSVKVKEIMPLESFFFGDSIRRQKHFVWTVDTYANHVKMKDIDTLLGEFNYDYPFQRKDVGDANVGIVGGVSTPLNFFRRPQGNDFTFVDGYYSYLYTPENAPHYNNKRPYTSLGCLTGGQKRYAEEVLRVVHAQNVTPSTGFNITYDSNHSRGIYNWQRGQVTDLSAAISHTGKRYSVHAGAISNTISNRENGGLTEAWHVVDTLYESAQGLPMKMSDALNKANNTALYLVQTYGIPFVPMTDSVFTMADRTAVYIGHSITYNRWNRNYSDTNSGTTYKITDRTGKVVDTRNYYDNWFFNPNATNDSLSESVLSNRLFVQFQPYDRNGVLGTVDGGIGWDHRRYWQFRPEDYLRGSSYDKRNTYYAYADAQGAIGKWFNWHGFARFNVGGYRAGDTYVDADARLNLAIKDKPVVLSGRFGFELEEPSYWAQNYISNHFIWSNNFSKQNRTDLEVTLQVPFIGAEVGFKQSVLGNAVYYNEEGLPSQMMGAVSVTGLYLQENLQFGILNMHHRLMLQYSTDQTVVPVPTVAANISYFLKFQPVKNVLTVKAGVDVWWNSPYYAQAYNPATMMFYNQREAEIGNYPYANVFLVAKWKTMRIFLQYQHASENLFEDYKASFSVPYYPYNRALFKYGISWYFDN
ncbi:MAG: putative porin [Tidjanibacter sp.]|nr:putative porin [Tidjanibacter sp.]